ncbi:N-acetylmuramoyl-L-alanine amidase [Fluviicola taffensis]|uniref:Peptidase C14 caspase catalytic subunit P20 n=1 Tax=Fluviicola taffensis (strain DSM 16823 / NCIMB 13979 / RW262) TaxID=755732 RepID=F2IJ85_FLUTR|nr:N-acetylmuramoyl-L-alanine amidase [Fluviicola taffensis]AEA44955.1 peptidase C14 caspase catalytic subunit P20 [Fluviicola taffensis DSM 16823]
MKIIQLPLLESRYFRTAYTKKQIVLHGSNSDSSPKDTVSFWHTNPTKFGSPFIIDRDGTIYQTFESHYWIHHIGIKGKDFTSLDQHSIGITLSCLGPLKNIDGLFYSMTNSLVDVSEIIDYGQEFRGSRYFHRYTDEQLQSLNQLLQKLCATYQIPKQIATEQWDISLAALDGKPGIFSSVNFRKDRSDCHPQPELIQMLLSL